MNNLKIEEFTIDNKKIKLIFPSNENTCLPLIILNSYMDNSEKIIEECQKLKAKDFILLNISNINWNDDLSPYYLKSIDKSNEDFKGEALNHLNLITDSMLLQTDKILKENNIKIKEYIIAGYSLAGLFAIYSLYHTTLFTKAISVSASLWYPSFLSYLKENTLKSKIECIYFSLGSKEDKTKNEYLKTVKTATLEIKDYFNSLNIKTFYEENEGNHFKDCEKRIAKGIKFILDN